MNYQISPLVGPNYLKLITWLLPLIAILLWLQFRSLWIIVTEIFLVSASLVIILIYFLATAKAPTLHGPIHPHQSRFKFMDQLLWKQELHALKIPQSLLDKPPIEGSPLIANRVSRLLELVVSQFIDSWLHHISSDTLFRDSVMAELITVSRNAQSRLALIDVSELLVLKILPIINKHLKRFSELRSTRPHLSASQDSKLALAKHFHLHKAVSLVQDGFRSEKAHLRRQISTVLPLLISPQELACSLGTDLLREILACTVLLNVLNAVSEYDFVNLMIVKFIGENLQRRERVRRLRAALQEHTQRLAHLDPVMLTAADRLDPKAYAFCVNYLKNPVSEASVAKLRATLVEIRRSALLPLEIQRIDALLRLIDGCADENTQTSASSIVDALLDDRFVESLIDTLGNDDTAKSYILLWRAIDTIKAPLEDGDSFNVTLHLKYADLSELKTIYNDFLQNNTDPMVSAAKKDVEAYLHSSAGDQNHAYSAARFSLFELQKNILDEIEHMNINGRLLSQHYKTYTERAPLQKHATLVKEPLIAFLPRTSFMEKDNEPRGVNPTVVEAVGNAFDQIMSNTPKLASAVPFTDLFDQSFGDGTSLFGENYGSSTDPHNDASETASVASSFDSDQISVSTDSSNLKSSSLEVLRAAPGDLSLSEEISRISREIENLLQQESLLAQLLRKAELTNNVVELRVLKKSKLSLDREITSKELQKQQYIVQESENSLFGKSKVQIQSYVVTNDKASRFVMYIIEVQKFSGVDPSEITAGWVVARRFSQFCQLHDYLKRRYPKARTIKLPKKSMPVLKSQKKQQLEERKQALQSYLQEMLSILEVCSDAVFRSFLSSETFLFKASKKIKSVVSTEVTANQGTDNHKLMQNMKEMQQELNEFDEWERKPSSKTSFVKPISDFLVDAFDLDKSSNWLRGRAFLVILQQVLGSAIEKSIRGSVQGFIGSETRMCDLFDVAINTIFPGGKFREPPEVRTRAQQLETKKEASAMLGMLMDDACSRVFGSGNTKMAFTNIFDMVQNDYINKSILHEVFDVFVAAITNDSKL